MKFVVALLIWMALIFVSSSMPQNVFPDLGSWVWPKLVHVLYFGVLALLVQVTLQQQRRFEPFWKLVPLVSILIAVLYGITDEVHQLFTPGRHARFTDVLIDGFGASLFILVSRAYRRFEPKIVKNDR
jgi:VanZ family protein